jgi:type IV fimbrial biogenesis protein FimT
MTQTSFQLPSGLRSRGFSLIELLVVVAIAGILLGIGVPNLRSFIVSNRLTTTANDFQAALNFARSEALRRGANVTVRTLGVPGSGDFSAGWQIITAAVPTPLQQGAAIDPTMSLRASAGVFGTDITFDSTGRLNNTGLVVLCLGGVLVENGESRSRALALAASGRVRQTQLNAARIPLNEAGVAIATCSPA